ncbi:protein YOP1 homolog [Amblyomma americanum]
MGACSCSRVLLVLGLVWPIYASFKCVDADRSQSAVLLKYWLSIGAYVLLDCTLEVLFGAHFPELVGGLRIVILVLMLAQSPQTFYDGIVRPRMKQWEPGIDKVIERFARFTRSIH